MTAQNKRAGGKVTTVGGFVPFANKYSSMVDPTYPDALRTEWRLIRTLSTYLMQDEGDAYMGISNASIYSKIKILPKYTQNVNKNPTVKLENKNYIMFYMGDYDGAAFLGRLLPGVWDDPKRGQIPLNWGFDGSLADRVPQVFDYVFKTKTSNDYFVMGDNGAGYLNIEQLLDAKRPKNLLGNVDSWVAYNKKINARFDLSVGGYYIFGTPVINASLINVLKQFSPDGIGTMTRVENKMVSGVPIYEVTTAFDNSVNVPYTIDYIHNNTKDVKTAPCFSSYRTIWVKPSQIVDIVDGLKKQYPERNYEVVDPYTFKNLYKQYYSK